MSEIILYRRVWHTMLRSEVVEMHWRNISVILIRNKMETKIAQRNKMGCQLLHVKKIMTIL